MTETYTKKIETLSRLQFQVTQEGMTEKPFENAYWNHNETGIYVDVVSGEVLFSSEEKFHQESGGPCFKRCIESGNIQGLTDRRRGMIRTELRSSQANSHPGHVFPDDTTLGGLRYCINSAVVRSFSIEDMAALGYAGYLNSFAKST